MSAELITQFYSAFAERNAAGMIAYYHSEVTFSDPAFTDLKGKQAQAMWNMLIERGTDLKIQFSDVTDNSAHWEAWYTFSSTGRKVHNIIEARFTFRDGLIFTHQDSFNFWRWSSQALGMVGMLGGWTPQVRRKVQQGAMQSLEKYMQKS